MNSRIYYKITIPRIWEGLGKLLKTYSLGQPNPSTFYQQVRPEYILIKYMVAAFGRSQKGAAAFGRRPLLGPYFIKKYSQITPEVLADKEIGEFGCPGE